jgi:hypothetical protein
MTASPAVDVRPLDAQRVEEAIETITERLPHLPRV